MMSPIECRQEAVARHSDALGLLTSAMKDLHMAYDCVNPLFWLTSAQKRIRDAEAVVERLRVFAESLRPR